MYTDMVIYVPKQIVWRHACRSMNKEYSASSMPETS
jgi:hypothetical protein